MKRFLSTLVFAFLFLSCKKEKPEDPAIVPVTVKSGTIIVKTLVYDSLGNTKDDKSGFRVLIQSGSSYTTDAGGEARFEDMEYGIYYPDVFRSGYDAPLTLVNLNVPEVTAVIPVARRSHYEISNFSGQGFGKDSILISFDLNYTVPAGQVCRVALFADSLSSPGELAFMSADVLEIHGNVKSLNIARLPEFRSAVEAIEENSNFFISVTPVSYGKYKSNAQAKPIILGENQKKVTVVPIQKNWK